MEWKHSSTAMSEVVQVLTAPTVVSPPDVRPKSSWIELFLAGHLRVSRGREPGAPGPAGAPRRCVLQKFG